MTRTFHLLEEKILAEGQDGKPEKVWQEVGKYASFEAASQAAKRRDAVCWCVQSLDGELRTWGAWGHGQAVRYDEGKWTPVVMEGRRLIPMTEADKRLSEWHRKWEAERAQAEWEETRRGASGRSAVAITGEIVWMENTNRTDRQTELRTELLVAWAEEERVRQERIEGRLQRLEAKLDRVLAVVEKTQEGVLDLLETWRGGGGEGS
jgi:hypothetical protein